MSHPEEEDLLETYYGSGDASVQAHAAQCVECRSYIGKLGQALEGLNGWVVPERDEAYGKQVWERLAPRLSVRKTRSRHLGSVFRGWRSWMLAPVLTALLAVAFGGGIWTEHKRALHSAKTRERVLLLAMSDHLERSQIILAELLHANEDSSSFAAERERARDLIDENRLMRESVARSGYQSQAALLDDLERVLLDIANGSDRSSSGDLKTLQQRIESEGLLWKVRISSDKAREKGQQL